MTKTLVAKRTIQVPGPKFKPAKIDPMTGGKLDAGHYDVKATAPGETFKMDDEAEADKLVSRGCAEWPKDTDKGSAKPAAAPPSK